MANTHLYFGIEALNISNQQRNTLVAELQSLGEDNAGPRPERRNHWRTRLDNQAVIFEALFNEDHLTIAAIKQRMATIFGINVSLITHSTNQVAYGLVVTYIRGGVNRLRSIAFGYDGGWPATSVSRAAAQAYLAANAAEWGDTE